MAGKPQFARDDRHDTDDAPLARVPLRPCAVPVDARSDQFPLAPPSGAAARTATASSPGWLNRETAREWIRRLGYRIGGLPIVLRAMASRGQTAELRLRRTYARRYFDIRTPAEAVELVVAAVVAPIVVVLLITVFAARNGAIVARREHRSIARQVLDQLRLYVGAGVLAPWYYVFQLYRQPTVRFAQTFAYRWETKGGVFHVLRETGSVPTSPLSDKVAFAAFTAACGLPTPRVLAVITPGGIDYRVPADDLCADLFVKRVEGRGGNGAQRWDFRDGLYHSVCGERLSLPALLERLRQDSGTAALMIQRRLTNHVSLLSLGNGALSTVRILTCLDRQEPRIITAAMRMAIGDNSTVDNLHRGGIAAAVDLESGKLASASNLGADAALGWVSRHPATGAPIAGQVLPWWPETCELAVRAHRHFGDRALVGWDIAITGDGPVIVEGNGSPDLDIAQRFGHRGLMMGLFTECLAARVERLRSGRRA